MKTLVAMISFGDRCKFTNYSFVRASKWAAKHGYSSILIKEKLNHANEHFAFGKMRVPEYLPGYERYCLIDDDFLVSSNAPALPDIPFDHIGVAPDAEQSNTTNTNVQWTGNNGMVVVCAGGLDLLKKAYLHGDDPSVWPRVGDQSALNAVAWAENRVTALDPAWNYQSVLEFFINGKGWNTWCHSKSYRLYYYFGLLLNLPNPIFKKTRNCYGLHIIRGIYPKYFNFILP